MRISYLVVWYSKIIWTTEIVVEIAVTVSIKQLSLGDWFLKCEMKKKLEQILLFN